MAGVSTRGCACSFQHTLGEADDSSSTWVPATHGADSGLRPGLPVSVCCSPSRLGIWAVSQPMETLSEAGYLYVCIFQIKWKQTKKIKAKTCTRT